MCGSLLYDDTRRGSPKILHLKRRRSVEKVDNPWLVYRGTIYWWLHFYFQPGDEPARRTEAAVTSSTAVLVGEIRRAQGYVTTIGYIVSRRWIGMQDPPPPPLHTRKQLTKHTSESHPLLLPCHFQWLRYLRGSRVTLAFLSGRWWVSVGVSSFWRVLHNNSKDGLILLPPKLCV